MAVKRLDNVGIVVEDLDVAIAFFLELGLALECRMPIEGEWAGRVTGVHGQRVEIELLLPVHLCDPLPRDRDERGQLGVVVSGAEVLEDGLHTPPGARDLHRRRSRPGAHLPHEQAHQSSLNSRR